MGKERTIGTMAFEGSNPAFPEQCTIQIKNPLESSRWHWLSVPIREFFCLDTGEKEKLGKSKEIFGQVEDLALKHNLQLVRFDIESFFGANWRIVLRRANTFMTKEEMGAGVEAILNSPVLNPDYKEKENP